MKKDTLFVIVTIVLLSLFSGIVITGIIKEKCFVLMISLTSGLLLVSILCLGIFDLIRQKQSKKFKEEKIDEIIKNLKFPEDTLVDIETVTTEKQTGEMERTVTTKRRNLNAELCKELIDVVAEL